MKPLTFYVDETYGPGLVACSKERVCTRLRTATQMTLLLAIPT